MVMRLDWFYFADFSFILIYIYISGGLEPVVIFFPQDLVSCSLKFIAATSSATEMLDVSCSEL